MPSISLQQTSVDFDPRFDIWTTPQPADPNAPAALQEFAVDEDPVLVANIEQMCRLAELAPPSPEALITFPPVMAGARRTRIVHAAVARATSCGLTLPIVLCRFVRAPASMPRGSASSLLAALARITVRDDIPEAELPGLLLHELQHAADIYARMFSTLSVAARERRACAFALRAAEGWDFDVR